MARPRPAAGCRWGRAEDPADEAETRFATPAGRLARGVPDIERRRCDGEPDTDRGRPACRADHDDVLPADVGPRPSPRSPAPPAPGARPCRPDGDRVAYVTDRSASRGWRSPPSTGATPPVVLSGPDQEVVSVAWSPDGAWLAYLVSPGGSICAELHVVRPDGTERRLLAGADPRATVFAGGWTGPGHYACSIATGDGPDADIVLVDVGRGAAHPRPRRLPVGHRGVGRRALRAGPARAARLPAHRRRRCRHRRAAPGAAARAPGGVASEDGRFGPDGRSVLPARLAARAARHRPGGAGRGPAVRGRRARGGPGGPCPPGRRPRRLRVRADGTVLAVWTVGGVTELGVHDLADGVAAARGRAAGAGHAGLVAGRRRRDAWSPS